ncbi:MAG: GIY-YIG nuclease family protein [Candidatus Aureabacteria bacterium]|nr:GIY-YIG nuclease family protein [Candidatus Auribacterota bacterium]
METATIRIFLAHGDPKRLRTAELSNWTGKAVAGPRSEFEDVLAREESERSGVYLLTGTDPESGNPAIYIGEAENIRSRIKSHVEKDFWNQAIYFVSKDENLTKSHIRYLEGRLIEHARAAGRAVVTNGQSSGAKLPESDREDMEVFLEKINQLLPVLGVDLLVPAAGGAFGPVAKAVLVCEIKSHKARGYRIPNGFLVLKGSEAVAHERASSEKWPWPCKMRQALKAEGSLIAEGDRLVFAKDVEFASPSAAAAVVHGGHANGLTAWKTTDGKTLKELESA